MGYLAKGFTVAVCALLALYSSIAFAKTPVASEKSETVYVYASADGEAQSVEVSVELANPEGSTALGDVSDLEDIAATSEGISYKQSGEELIWQARGEDVSYRGTSTADAPVRISVSYRLDGVELDADKIAGKSGHVQIRFDYEALSGEGSLDGQSVDEGSSASESKSEDSSNASESGLGYTPFACVTALMLDSERFSDIEAENAKTMDVGESVVVLGYAMPGLQSYLGLDEGGIEIPEHVVIEADVEDFALDTTVTFISPNLFDDFDSEDIDISEMSDSMDDLEQATSQLVDGGTDLNEAVSALSQGASQLSEGSASLESATQSLSSSASQLNSGAQGLSDGIDSYTGGVSQAASGAESLAGLTALQAQSSESARDKLDAWLSDAAADASDKAAAADAAQGTADAAQAAFEQAAQAARDDASAENLDALVSAAEDYASANAQAASARALADAAQGVSSDSGLAELSSELDGVSQGASGISEAAQGLSSGLVSLADNGSSLAQGADSLKSGTGQLASSTPQLSEGAGSLSDGVASLASGATQVSLGTSQLAEGLRQYSDEGISKLTDFFDDDVKGLLDKLDEMSSAGRAYDNFSGISQGTEGSVSFIYQTEAIGDVS